ncbi:MAG: trypsin-like serine peptidase, partial [Allosphingosinicella sp.]
MQSAPAASPQGATLEEILEPTPMTPVQATSAAVRRLLKIRAFPAGAAVARKEGTGILIAPRLLLTAGHVVHDPDAAIGFGGYAERVVLSSPFLAADGAAAASTDITAHPEWVSNRDRGSDLALIVLAGAWPGADSFAPMALATGDMAQRRMWAFGYPNGENTPFYSAGGCMAAIADLLYHTADV